MTLTYDPPDGSYTTTIPPGQRALNEVVADTFDPLRIETVRDRDRCDTERSAHCECRGSDAFYPLHDPAGAVLANALVGHAEPLGIQGVVWDGRRWGFGDWSWRDITSGHRHEDHVHYETTRHAASTLDVATIRRVLEPTSDDGAGSSTPMSHQPWFSKNITSGPYAGRRPAFGLDAERSRLLGFNGVDFWQDAAKTRPADAGYGVAYVWLPEAVRGRARLSPDEASDGSGVVVLDPSDGGTMFYPYRGVGPKPVGVTAVELDRVVDQTIAEIVRRLS